VTILDYGAVDLQFAHWLKRQRDYMATHQPVPAHIRAELNRLAPLRNPHCSIFILG
jgi:hypothetical protein